MLKKVQFKTQKHTLQFKFEAGTSRGVLKQKHSYFIKAYEAAYPNTIGWGEAAPLPLLSIDDLPNLDRIIEELCQQLSGNDIFNEPEAIFSWVVQHIPNTLPSLRFAFETALLDLNNGGKKMIFDTLFFHHQIQIPINGLVWMGTKDFMLKQIDEKLAAGFECIKIKIGAIDFEEECSLLRYIRTKYTADQITLRVDANGAFSAIDALQRLQLLSEFELHSIEQPVKQGNIDVMKRLCKHSPLPIALDEELIGVQGYQNKLELLLEIKPHYIVLKPTLLGGILSTIEWINIAESLNIGWWITSALESNVGLNAIAQFTSTYHNKLPQGLGTGQLYENNISSPLVVKDGFLRYEAHLNWT
jgi:o-succinylbenzoate synthase